MTAPHDSGWDDNLRELLAAEPQQAVGDYLDRLPPGYREQTSPAEAAKDFAELSQLPGEAPGSDGSGPTGAAHTIGAHHRLVVRPANDSELTFRLRRFADQGMELTRALPLLESFGLVVVESVPTRLGPGRDGQPALHVDDMGIRVESPAGPEALRFVPEIHGGRLVEAIEASARGDSDVDSLNQLVTAAGLDWRQVTVLRAYLRYWLQAGTTRQFAELADPLVRYPDVARALVAYFQARFTPAPGAVRPGTDPAPVEGARTVCTAELDAVTQLADDRILRAVLALVDATLRTNYYAAPDAGSAKRPLVLKFDSRAVPDLPSPRPCVEAFVHGPTIEGVHLRAGLIARGGLRWSERAADFRTEVLDLAFAQVKKNAIIVPTGAKGGFVCRSATTGPGPARVRPTPEQVRSAYELFVAGLLEITDNYAAGEIAAPEGIVAWDGTDPYLVVAADKGTATFSDLANSISEQLGFWLGDAFASGGSRGYDHKAMGITARGAWVAVRRHFRELGVDVSSEPVRVAGVGDMSGDVFGNGMLRSRAIRLVAAFDHRHIFIDPDPDPEVSFEERLRLSRLERSSWADYRPELISAGGGVWSRESKAVDLSAEAAAVFGLPAGPIGPPELVPAILGAPVDLLWFGGIGTYIKAPDEPDVEVGDHANDAVRITSDQVRARVIAEGANLGVTQKARIRYSRRGGRINADFVDNAAGVATSDREVNLKILLTLAIERGRLDPNERDAYLQAAEDEVAAEVLRQVDHSVAALNRAAGHSERDLDAYEALVDSLEEAGRCDRKVEVLPDRDEFAVRRAAGAGLIRPELATILAFAKSDVVAAIEASPGVSDEVFLGSVVPYFPKGIREDFGDLIPQHRLYPQLVATDVAGEVVDQMGVVWAHDLAGELGRDLDEVAAAFWVAREVTGAGDLWAHLETAAAAGVSESAATDGIAAAAGLPAAISPAAISPAAEAALHDCVVRAVTRLVRFYLGGSGRFEPAAVLQRDRRATAAMAPLGPLPAESQAIWERLKVEEGMARRFLLADHTASYVQAAQVARRAGASATAEAALAVMERVGGAAGLAELAASVSATVLGSPPPDRLRVWQARALLDDIGSWKRRAALEVLIGPAAGSPEQAADHWLAARGSQIGRAAVGRGPGGNADPLAVASLMMRRLERVLDMG